jgi:molybdate transport system substrate-binding protein
LLASGNLLASYTINFFKERKLQKFGICNRSLSRERTRVTSPIFAKGVAAPLNYDHTAIQGAAMTTIKVLSTTAVKSSLDEIVPAFERTTGHTISLTYTPSAQIAARVLGNETADIVIGTKEILDELAGHCKLVNGSVMPIAKSLVGLAVPQGAPKPDISSVPAFKATLLKAKFIATSNPVGGGQSGKYLAAIFDRLGITEALKPKLLYGPGGPAGLIGFFLVRGEADIGIQQMPELLSVPGIDIVGVLPAEITIETIFSIAVLRAASNRDSGLLFAGALKEARSGAIMQSKGFSPPA